MLRPPNPPNSTAVVHPSADVPDTDVLVENPADARSYELDALASILPPERRDRMAEILTDEDVATLKHLAKEGMGRNTLRALASDLHYLETWALAALGQQLPWPTPEALVLKFLAHHLYDPAERDNDPAHGMPASIETLLRADGCLRSIGPHAPATVRRRLAIWSTLHKWRGVEGPFASGNIKAAIHLTTRASNRPRLRKSRCAVTRDILEALLATCTAGSISDVRDQALLLVAFASGGRRRSEIAKIRLEDLVERDPVMDETGTFLACLAIRLGRTKTAGLDQDERVLVIGRPVSALKQWIALAPITGGAIFRSIDRFGRIGRGALDAQSVNAIVKKRCLIAGLDPSRFSAHGLRSGYLTEAARRGVPLQEAMQQSRHRSVQQAAAYYNETDLERGQAARLSN